MYAVIKTGGKQYQVKAGDQSRMGDLGLGIEKIGRFDSIRGHNVKFLHFHAACDSSENKIIFRAGFRFFHYSTLSQNFQIIF